jgi:acyl-CoA reductase-like NAD-dependent aldehyde dehydrogenase
LQLGLVLKPGPQEPWTPYRMTEAFAQAGIPREAISIYPGEGDVGAAVLEGCGRSLIFGGTATVDRYRGNPRVQAHGPGFSKILFGDDQVDAWDKYLDVMVDSVFANSGRGCINCSGIWASRHTREIAQALAERIGPVAPKPPEDPESSLAAFTVPGAARAIWKSIEENLDSPGVHHATGKFGARLVEKERCGYIRPTVIHCDSPDAPLANTEFMFPFVSVVRCPQDQLLSKIGPTLVGTVITSDPKLQSQFLTATHIDRLNIGAIPTIKLDWLQPHEGNIVEFLFRPRAFQASLDAVAI